MKENKEIITGSFSDINSLKTNAQQMVILFKIQIDIAQQIRTKLSSLNKNDDPAMLEIKKVLDNIGYIDPVTKETSGKDYYIKLAEQVNRYFTDYLENNVGIIILTDAYGVYNRARGISK